MNKSLATAVTLLLVVVATPVAQRGPAPDPLVKEGRTVKVAPHTYVIPDDNVALVPNVGIVVGSRATLVIDPGLGRRNGEAVLREVAKVSKNSELFIVSTHFHPEHTTGYVAFPESAQYVNSKTQEAEFEQNGAQMIETFSKRSPLTAELLKDAARRPAAVTFDRDYTIDLGGVRVRCLVVGPTHTRGDTGFLVEGDNVLFAGDVVMNNSFLAATAVSSFKAWTTALETFDGMKPEFVVPAHGEVGPGSIIGTHRSLLMIISARVHVAQEGGPSRRRGRDDRPARDPGDATDLAARQRHRRAGAGGLQRTVIIDVQSITNRQ